MMKHSNLLKLVIVAFVLILGASSVFAEGPQLVGAFFVKGKVGLKWIKVAGATEYVIYRKTADTEFAKLTTTEKTNYFDTDLIAGAVFTYKIAALLDGNEVDGNTKDVKLPAEIDAFSAPKGVAIIVNSRATGLALRWERVKGAIAYNVMRSSTAGSGHELVGNVSKDTYTDSENLISGTTYHYIITAMNEEFEESAPSNEVSIKFGLSKEEQIALDAAESNIHLDSIKLEFVFEITEANGKPLNSPTNFAFNSKGDIYITDKGNLRVVCTDSQGKAKFDFGFAMEPEDREDPPEGGFLAPFQIAIDNKDQVYVADIVTNDIQIFTAEGKFVKRIRVPAVGKQHKLRANGLDIFDDGRILCTDVGNGRVLIIDTDGNILNEYNGSATFLTHFPNGIKIVDDNSFVHTNPVIGTIVVSNLKGEKLLHFGGMGTNVGTFGRAVGISISEDGMYWVTDAMGGTIQGFNKEGEVKIAISNKDFTDESQLLAGPRGIEVRDGFIYIASERSNKIMVFKYEITKTEK